MPDRPANPMRGEAGLNTFAGSFIFRPSFEALTAAEEELGSLFGLVERAADGQLLLSEVIALFWHCTNNKPDNPERGDFATALTAMGLAQLTPPLKILLKQILTGKAPDDQAV